MPHATHVDHYLHRGTEIYTRSRSLSLLLNSKTARRCLTEAGIPLYTFTHCPQEMIPYKTLYFEVLHIIRQRRKCCYPSLQGDSIPFNLRLIFMLT
jgi:hypothetical protein